MIVIIILSRRIILGMRTPILIFVHQPTWHVIVAFVSYATLAPFMSNYFTNKPHIFLFLIFLISFWLTYYFLFPLFFVFILSPFELPPLLKAFKSIKKKKKISLLSSLSSSFYLLSFPHYWKSKITTCHAGWCISHP